MKFILAVFTLLCALSLTVAQYSSYGQTISVSSVSTSYNFSSSSVLGATTQGPILVVSSTQSQASSFISLSQLLKAPSVTVNFGNVPVNYALPAGYSLISGAPQVGYIFNLSSDLNNSPAFSGLLNIPSYQGYTNLSSQGQQLGLLYFDAQNQSYSAVPSTDFNVSNAGAITVRILRSVQLVIASQVIGTIPFNVSSTPSSVYVLGNTPQSFSIIENGNAALLISNLSSQAGGFSVSVSNATDQLSAIRAQNLTLVSSIYTFNHSAGASSIRSAVLSYNLALSPASNFSSTAAQWYSFNPQTNALSLVSGSSLASSLVNLNAGSLSGSYAVLSTLSNIQLNSYNVSLPVSTSASVFSFGKSQGLGPILSASAANAVSTSSVVVSPISSLPSIQIPSGSSFSTFNLPSGFSSLSSLTGQQGFNVIFSPDLNGSPSLSSVLTLPALPNYASLLSAGSVVVPLSYNASAPSASSFSALPSNNYQVLNNGSVRIILTRSLSFILASYNPRSSIVTLTNSASATFLLASNYAQSVSITNAAGILSLVLNNITASAGSLSVQSSNNAAAESSAARSAGRAILSNIYNITHSAGASAFSSAQIIAYINSLSLNSSSSYDVNTAQWYRYNTANSAFDSLGGSLGSDSNGQYLSAPISSLQYSDLSVQASSILSAVYSQPINVTSNPTAYRFSSINIPATSAPVLVVSAPNASPSSSVNVAPISSLPRIPVNVGNATSTFTLPSGYSPLSLAAIQQGFSFNFSSDLVSSGVNAVLQVPAAALSLLNNYGSSLVVLTYNATSQTYAAVPTSQYSVSADGSVSLNVVPQSVNNNFIFAINNFSANVINVANGGYAYFLLAANSSQSFALQQGNNIAVAINNLTAEAGTLYVALSNNAAAELNAINSAGNVLASNIYTFTHSLGSQAVRSAVLQFNLNQTSVAGLDASSVSWYRFNTASNVWEERSSSVSGSAGAQVVVTTTSSFSDWSVQSRNASPSSSAANVKANFMFKVISQLF